MSKFQPDHNGLPTPDNSGGKSLSRSHGAAAEQPARHGDKPNIARDAGKAKHTYDVQVHGGMSKQTKSGPMAFGGDHASAIDSLSGRETVPGKPGTAATAHPLTAPPTAKNLAPVKPSWNNRSRTGGIARSLDDDTLYDLGCAVRDEAKS
jgi:hypothetical protein